MGKQPTTFRITGTESVVTRLDVESFFDKVNKHVGLKYAFAGIGLGSNAFLLNLKNKATLTFVEKALERALGSQYSAESVATSTGQKFVPGERRNEGRCKATIELEAAAATAASHHEDSPAKIFVLVGVSQRATYSYTQAGLVKVGKNEDRPARPLENGNPMPAGEEAGVASGLVAPHHQLLPLSHKLPAEFSSDAHGRALNGQARGGGGGGGGEGGGGGGEGNNGACKPIDDRPDESLPLQSFPGGGGGGGGKLHEHSVATALRTVASSLCGPALGGQGVNGMSAEDGGWEGELPHWHIEFEYLPDGSIGDGDEGKHGGGKGQTVDVVGAAAPTRATSRPERPENRQERRLQIPVGSPPSIVPSIDSTTSYHDFYKRGGSTSSFGPESERLLKVAVHEALELERWSLLCDTASTPLQSVPDLASVMNSSWDKGGRIFVETERLSPRVHLDPIAAVRRILPTGRDPSIHVPKLVDFVQNEDDPALQLQAGRLLATISGTHAKVVVQNGAVPVFVRLLTSANDDVREEVVRAVGNIAGDSPLSRDLVLQRDALGPLLQQLTDRSKLSMLRIATWALSKFCGEISPARLKQVGPALPTLARLTHSIDEEVLRNACAALRYLCTPGLTDFGAHREMVQAVVGTGVCQRLVELLDHASPAVHLEVLWAMDGIVSSEIQHAQELIYSNVLPRLHHQLISSHQKLRWKACQVICRITSGREEQIQAVIEAGVIPTVIQFLADVNSNIRRFAASAISNAAEVGEPEEVKGWIPALLSLLKNDDTQVIPTVIEILEKLLKVVPDFDAWRRLRHLLSSSNTTVREKTCQVIDCITRGNKEQSRAMIDAGIVPALIEHLDDAKCGIRSYAASAISNATEVGELEEVKGWIPALLSLLENDDARVVPTVIEILEKLLKMVPDSDAWRRLRHLLSSSDTIVLEKTCQVINCITRGNKEQSRAMIDAGIVPALIEHLDDAECGIRSYAASAISNATEVGELEEVKGWIPALLSLSGKYGDTEAITTVIEVLEKLLKMVPDSDAWRWLRHLLSSSDTVVRERTCQVIDCITRGNKEQPRAMIDAGIVPALIEHLDDAKCGIRSFVASAILNATKLGAPEEVRAWIPLLLSRWERFDIVAVVVNALEILEKILERGDTDAKAQGQEMNQMAACMTECGGWKHLQRLERFGFSESVGRISFCDIGPKHKARELLRRFNNLEDEFA